LQQEDYIKRQIDQLGRVLGKILADLTGLKSQGQMGDGIEAADHALQNDLGLNISELNAIPIELFISRLQTEKGMRDQTFEQLAGILFTIAEELDDAVTANEKKQKLYERSLVLYEHLDTTSSTYSFDRHMRIEKIKKSRS
jgi:hypothetical protein